MLRLAFVLCVLLVACACVCVPVFALSVRGHVPDGSFGALGSGDGQFSGSVAVAVNEAGGDVYVLDRVNSRVERFDSEGKFVAVWGWGVVDGKAKFEVCESGCRAGIGGAHAYQLGSASEFIAVDDSSSGSDPSKGDVYVQGETGEGTQVIDKFSPTGERLEAIKGFKEEKGGEVEPFEEIHGLAVGADGMLWVYDEELLYGLSDVKPRGLVREILQPEFGGEPANGLAVDGEGGFYLAQALPTGMGTPVTVVSRQRLVHAQDGTPELRRSSEEVDGQPTSAVAVDQSTGKPRSGETYLQHGTSVAVLDSGGGPVETLGQGELQSGGGVAVDAARGRVYVADGAANRIDVFGPQQPGAPVVDELSAQDVTVEAAQLDAQIDPNGAPTAYTFQYGTVPCSSEPSACTSLPVVQLGGGSDEGYGDVAASVKLGPEAGTPLSAATTYHYRVLATNGHPPGAGQPILEGAFTTRAAGGPFVADLRDWEMVSPVEKNGATVEPPSKEGAVIQAAASGGAVSYVTDGPLGGAQGSRSLEPTQILSTRAPGGWSSEDVVTPNDQGTGLVIGEQEYRVFSSSLALALVQPFREGGGPLAEPPLSPPVSEGERGHQEKTVYLRADRPLVPESSETADYEQAVANGEAEHNPGFLALVSEGNVLAGAHFGKQLEFRDATPDLSHVLFSSTVPLIEGSAAGENLYEWVQGKLTLVNVLENGQAAGGAQLGGDGMLLRHAVSDDGSRVFWSGEVQGEKRLFMRDMRSSETVRLDVLSGGVGGEHLLPAQFQTASSDGSVVFFSDEQALTKDSHAVRESPDLYACRIVRVAGKLKCELSDLTSGGGGEHANVRGLVLGASEDGQSVFFLAGGVLDVVANARGEKALAGRCGGESWVGAGCNLYSERYDPAPGHEGWEGPRFVVRLSSEDEADWSPLGPEPGPGDLGNVTSRVSPNGRFLAFMSDRSLTGYDNRDVNPEAKGARDEEVFLFDASTGGLVCASCDPSGARPRGVFDPPEAEPANVEGWGLFVDRPKVWQGRWLAGSVPGAIKVDRLHALYQSRYLSDSGRLFFQSPADLLPEAVNHKNDIYEFEPQGVPRGVHQCTSASVTFVHGEEGCLGLVSSGTAAQESAFLDASVSGGEGEGGETLSEGGGDVFFATAAKLSPKDTGTSFDVYDAHECTGVSPCISPASTETPVSCEETGSCRPYTPPFSSSGGAPASGAPSSGSGNLTPQHRVLAARTGKKPKTTLSRAQKLAKALKDCRAHHKHSKAKRKACERQARKHYTAKKTANSAAKRGPGVAKRGPGVAAATGRRGGER